MEALHPAAPGRLPGAQAVIVATQHQVLTPPRRERDTKAEGDAVLGGGAGDGAILFRRRCRGVGRHCSWRKAEGCCLCARLHCGRGCEKHRKESGAAVRWRGGERAARLAKAARCDSRHRGKRPPSGLPPHAACLLPACYAADGRRVSAHSRTEVLACAAARQQTAEQCSAGPALLRGCSPRDAPLLPAQPHVAVLLLQPLLWTTRATAPPGLAATAATAPGHRPARVQAVTKQTTRRRCVPRPA